MQTNSTNITKFKKKIDFETKCNINLFEKWNMNLSNLLPHKKMKYSHSHWLISDDSDIGPNTDQTRV